MKMTIPAIAFAALTLLAAPSAAQDAGMSFFITSVGVGDGANLGGLAGADAHCTSLAEAAGVTGKTWHAYLSTSDTDASDRIGAGPWVNAKGETIAASVADLHSDANPIGKATGLDEKGMPVKGRGDEPNQHDMLTGTMADGTKAAETCNDWTSNAADGSAMLGHHDRVGPESLATATSWNAAHPSRGCNQEGLVGTGGAGLFYCFASN